MNQRDQRQGHGRNDGTGRSRSCRRPARRRAGALAAVMAGASILAAACGGGSDSPATTGHAKAVAYAQCIRSHGVPGWPDPDSQGQFEVDAPAMGINMNSPAFASANRACAHLDPAFSSPLSSGEQQKFLTRALEYVACMRSHGVTGMPDPEVKSRGRVSLMLPNPSSPTVLAAQQACRALQPGAAGPGS